MYPFIGQIQLFAFQYEPQHWMRCEGQYLSVSQYQALFALIGITYGGDGRTNFRLPDLRGAEPTPNLSYYIALDGDWPPRQ